MARTYTSAVRAERAAASRDAVIAAASELFAERGYEGVRVQDVASRAGVTTGTIYGHFPGRSELLAAAVDAHVGELLMSVVQGGVTTLEELVDVLGPRLIDDPAVAVGPLGLEALIALRRDPSLVPLVTPRVSAVTRQLAELPGSADATAYALFAIAIGAALLAPVTGIRPDPAEWEELSARLRDALVAVDPHDPRAADQPAAQVAEGSADA